MKSKMSNPKFSIVIAIYNAQQHVEKVVRQISSQIYENFECIFVNDGSTDKTAQMLKKEISGDKRFKIIRRDNGGPSAARNSGLAAAKGQYVIFIDADDEIDCRLLETANKRLEQTGDVDVLAYNFSVYRHGKRFHTPNIDISVLPNQPVFGLREIKRMQLTTLTGFLWCKCFSLDFLKKHRLTFLEKIHASDDYVFSLRALVLAEKITFVDEMLYFYQEFSSGGMTYNFRKYATDYLDAAKIIHDFLVKQKLYDVYERSFLYSFLTYFYETLYRNMQYDTFKSIYRQGKKMAHEYGFYDHDLEYYYNQKERFENCMYTKDADEVAYLSFQITQLLKYIKQNEVKGQLVR
jgi:glycosyltransferase involved in cell wall biosynthesis